MAIKTTIEVEIDNIDIKDKSYSFDYIVRVNDSIKKEGVFHNKHFWRGKKEREELRELLEVEEATKLVLLELFDQ